MIHMWLPLAMHRTFMYIGKSIIMLHNTCRKIEYYYVQLLFLYIRLGIKVQNMKMDFNPGGTKYYHISDYEY